MIRMWQVESRLTHCRKLIAKEDCRKAFSIPMTKRLNIADRLRKSAALYPYQRAVVFPAGRDRAGRVVYSQLTFEQIDRESDSLARGLQNWGVKPGTRIVLMVRPSLEFIALTFALFKTGAIVVLIDPGMGRSNIFQCLEEVKPEGFVAIPIVQWIRRVKSKLFPHAKYNVTVGGPNWLLGGKTYGDIRVDSSEAFHIADTNIDDPAAIIFTSGSTGPPKGVLYEHGMFDAQVDLIRDRYDIQPGEVDLPGFPLFALFNLAMGVTTVIPDMDPTRPAQVDVSKLLEAIADQGVTQAFGSPAIWNRVGIYCEKHNITLPSIKRVLSAGAPVPVHVVSRMAKALTGPGADLHTPYGATESLPVASICGQDVLSHTAEKTRQGAGTCVGHPYAGVDVKVIQIQDGPIENISDAVEVAQGEIGEIIVKGPMATREYYRRPEATKLAKITEGTSFWHRMGDVGYLDESGALWFCGRKAHIVETEQGRMFTIPVEAIFNEHPSVFRSALVGIGDKPSQTPVIIIEPEQSQFPNSTQEQQKFISELKQLGEANELTRAISKFLFHRSLPVDIRHNVKIFREKLAPWAAKQLQ